mgnify:CR=1 FL=1
MALIDQIYQAVEDGHIPKVFSTADVKNWVQNNNVLKEDGNPYAEGSIDAILSNSCLRNEGSTNRNRKVLDCKQQNEVNVYWFYDRVLHD